MTTGKTRTIFVPNAGAEGAKILVVGEAPGEEEEDNGKPFYEGAAAGEKITNCFGRNGIDREKEVFFANLCNYRPAYGNKFELVLGTPELESGIRAVSDYLEKYRPNVVVATGNYPLHFLTGKGSWKKGKLSGINKWRGSILSCSLPGLEHIKVIPTFHPSYIARDPTKYPIFDADIKRVVNDSKFPELRLPERRFIIDPKYDELEYWVKYLLSQPEYSFDLEVVGNRLACCGFSADPKVGICLVNDGSSHFNDALENLLTSESEKVPHFGTFDQEYTRLERGLVVTNVKNDTYIMQHVLNPELPKSLAFLGSTLTREVYWKDDPYKRKSSSESDEGDKKTWNEKGIVRSQLYPYNCKDACVTIESKQTLDKEVSEVPQWKPTIEFEMECVDLYGEISRAGLAVDEERRGVLRTGFTYLWANAQADLNALTGFNLNVNSSKQVCALLYDGLKLPEHRNRETGDRTADEDALISLLGTTKAHLDKLSREGAKEEWIAKLLIIKLIWMIRGLRKRRSTYIDFDTSADGKVRSSYKMGPETGRGAAEKYVDGTGVNSQTFPRDPIEFAIEALNYADDPSIWKEDESEVADRVPDTD